MEGRDLFHSKLETGVSRESSFGNLKMDVRSQSIKNIQTGVSEKLSKSEYQILWILVRAQGNIITETEFSDFLYEDLPDSMDLPLSDTVKVFMTKVRRKLERIMGTEIQISTEHGMGYRLQLESGKEEA